MRFQQLHHNHFHGLRLDILRRVSLSISSCTPAYISAVVSVTVHQLHRLPVQVHLIPAVPAIEEPLQLILPLVPLPAKVLPRRLITGLRLLHQFLHPVKCLMVNDRLMVPFHIETLPLIPGYGFCDAPVICPVGLRYLHIPGIDHILQDAPHLLPFPQVPIFLLVYHANALPVHAGGHDAVCVQPPCDLRQALPRQPLLKNPDHYIPHIFIHQKAVAVLQVLPVPICRRRSQIDPLLKQPVKSGAYLL